MDLEISDRLERNLKYLGLTLLLAVAIIGLTNLTTPSEYPDVGFTEVDVECVGLDLGICLGLQTETHTTHSYDDWEEIEEGTEDHRRMIESELMIRAYEECRDPEIVEMDWTSEATFENQTADEWEDEIDDLTLLPCEETFYFSIDD